LRGDAEKKLVTQSRELPCSPAEWHSNVRSNRQSIRQPRSRHKQPYSLRLRKQRGRNHPIRANLRNPSASSVIRPGSTPCAEIASHQPASPTRRTTCDNSVTPYPRGLVLRDRLGRAMVLCPCRPPRVVPAPLRLQLGNAARVHRMPRGNLLGFEDGVSTGVAHAAA